MSYRNKKILSTTPTDYTAEEEVVYEEPVVLAKMSNEEITIRDNSYENKYL